MYWSKFFIPTLKEVPVGTDAMSHQLMLRAGLVNMLTSGVYSYLPLGLRVLKNIEAVIRKEMNSAGAIELFLPVLQPLDLWKQTKRDETLKDVMIQFVDKRNRGMCLGPTHEEVITQLVKNYVQSYRQLPITLYQIQTKFRDELRTRFGVVRACEFIMKDAYSFDRDIDGLKKNYDLMYQAYLNIFARCDLNIVVSSADSGAMGGDVSHEFLVPAAIGEDAVLTCPSCGNKTDASNDQEGQQCRKCQNAKMEKEPAIEMGHIFQLGTKYSKALEALFLDEESKQQPIIMGCYGIGVSRLIAAIIETHYDEKGIIWPREVSPFDLEIVPVQADSELFMTLATNWHDDLESQGISVLVDDRAESAGRKFNDADLIGIPYRIIIGKRTKQEGVVEVKNRKSGEVVLVKKEEVVSHIKNLFCR